MTEKYFADVLIIGGGAGAKLFADDSPTKLTWQILKTDGEKIFLEVDKRQSNKF